ncbi:gamma-glutamylcyclotransferase family protein [Pelagibacterium luteolum]|uniref:Putative gamma-glutamylcyclotransferase n=1 Tax=Pelagibacterium luteolum TaxID=440168 RepID=A0A1G7SA25_9HYPH|nr:gamma-glutamylcyclotransferase family protein [Pelagibacterium luteolum]SDG19309.1 Uncharacterized conserved protein YtfP, gamma-glutamylcyclotransferase (GGCT)/AIG2-like family [Pelagibacterium luteolum]
MSRAPRSPCPSAVSLFVYGTLRDKEVRDAVAGKPIAPHRLMAAQAHGWRTVYFPGAHFPGLVPAKGHSAEGLIISNLSKSELDRLDLFEGADYVRTSMAVMGTDGPQMVEVYLPAIDIGDDAKEWSLSRWARLHRRAELAHYRATLFKDLDERTNR